MERFAESPATIQIAQHGFRKYVSRFRAFSPLELLVTTGQVLERVFEPEQIHFSLAHGNTTFALDLAGTVEHDAISVPGWHRKLTFICK